MKPPRLGAVVLLVGLGCASELDDLRTRAAFDFQCSESEIKIVNLDADGHSYGVTGCDHRSTYLYICGDLGDCRWVKND